MTKITSADLDRLAAELDERRAQHENWVPCTGLEDSAMASFISAAAECMTECSCCREHAIEAGIEIAGQSFRLGWELRDQYGRPKEVSEE